MDGRLRKHRLAALAVLGAALLLSAPWIGLWTVGALIPAAGVFAASAALAPRVKNPAYVLFAAWTLSQVIIAVSVALTNGPRAATMCWFAIPIVTLSARFSTRGVVLGVLVTLLLMVAVTFGVDARAFEHYPPLLIGPAALVLAIAVLNGALMDSDFEHRHGALKDPLTGLANRNAALRRAEDLEQQSAARGFSVGVIVGDLDRFKQVNDEFGHTEGDRLLAQIAQTLGQLARDTDTVARMGGDEFLILCPGCTLPQTRKLAERLHHGLAAHCQHARRHGVTMTLGVAASSAGTPFDYSQILDAADGALRQAKQAGRNRVGACAESEDLDLAPGWDARARIPALG